MSESLINQVTQEPLATDVVSFAVGAEQYGVEIVAVREIKSWTEITRLPNQPDYMRGVLNLRGMMVPIIDLRCRLGQGKTEETPFHVVIVVNVRERNIGMLVDRVLDIVSIATKAIQPVPEVECQPASCLSGLVAIDSELIALIDLQKLITVEGVLQLDGKTGLAA